MGSHRGESLERKQHYRIHSKHLTWLQCGHHSCLRQEERSGSHCQDPGERDGSWLKVGMPEVVKNGQSRIYVKAERAERSDPSLALGSEGERS